MTDKLFLDTNIIVYAYDNQTPEKQAKAQHLLKTAIQDETGVLSSQVLSEFLVVVTRKIKVPMSVDDAEKIIDILTILPVIDIDHLLVKRAIGILKAYGISYWDSLIVAAAERAECEIIISEDLNQGQRYEGVIVENPFM